MVANSVLRSFRGATSATVMYLALLKKVSDVADWPFFTPSQNLKFMKSTTVAEFRNIENTTATLK